MGTSQSQELIPVAGPWWEGYSKPIGSLKFDYSDEHPSASIPLEIWKTVYLQVLSQTVPIFQNTCFHNKNKPLRDRPHHLLEVSKCFYHAFRPQIFFLPFHSLHESMIGTYRDLAFAHRAEGVCYTVLFVLCCDGTFKARQKRTPEYPWSDRVEEYFGYWRLWSQNKNEIFLHMEPKKEKNYFFLKDLRFSLSLASMKISNEILFDLDLEDPSPFVEKLTMLKNPTNKLDEKSVYNHCLK